MTAPTITLTPEEVIAIRQWATQDRRHDGGDATVQGIGAKVDEAIGQLHDTKRAESCLTTGCTRRVQTRGCCSTCYQQHQRAVRKKQTTWQELIEKGLIKPSLIQPGYARHVGGEP